jgi:hypothetical protein
MGMKRYKSGGNNSGRVGTKWNVQPLELGAWEWNLGAFLHCELVKFIIHIYLELLPHALISIGTDSTSINL